jgi:chromate transporter
VRGAIEGVTLAAAGLITASAVPLARDAMSGAGAAVIACAAFVLLIRTRLDTLWLITGAMAAGTLLSLFL